MDVKVAFVLVCLCTLAITSSGAGIRKCCIKTREHIPPQLLYKVERWYVQQSNGACDISALQLYIKGRKKPICAPMKLKTALERWRMKQEKLKLAF